MLPQTALFFHIAGIMLIGGGSISAILGEKQLWKKVNVLSPDARVWVNFVQSATMFIFIGMIVFLVSGLLMLYVVNWVYLSQPWFIAKLIYFVLLPVRGAFVGRPTMALIDRQLQENNYNMSALMKLRSKMNRFHIIQFILVATIIFLVIFKV